MLRDGWTSYLRHRFWLRVRLDLEAGPPQQSSGAGVAETELTSPTVDDPSQPQRQMVPIPRVRGLLRRSSCDLFTPETMVIGPYHVKKGSHLFQSTGVKDKAVEDIRQSARIDLDGLNAALSNLENDVRPRYTHLPERSMNSQAFSRMLLLDGCYLLCRFLTFECPTETCDDGGAGSSSGGGGGGPSGGTNGGGSGSGGCSSSSSNGVGGGGSGSGSGSGSHVGAVIAADTRTLDKEHTLVRDILYLIENQIPFCVLEEILVYINGTENLQPALEHIYQNVQKVLHKQFYISEQRLPVPSTSKSTPSDLLHLVYSYFRRGADYVPPGSPEARHAIGMRRWRQATDYHKYADMQFRPRKFQEGQQWTILDMDMRGGTLYIAPVQVHTDTMTMLRNLMALEEQEEERPVTAYCLFLSQVACTAEDVQLLQRAGILQHFMPSDQEAAKELAYLCTGVAMDIDSSQRNYLKSVWHDLEKRCSKPVHNLKGFFRQKYCSTMLYRLVFFVAILTFLSAVTQAIYAVIAYHKPPHS